MNYLPTSKISFDEVHVEGQPMLVLKHLQTAEIKTGARPGSIGCVQLGSSRSITDRKIADRAAGARGRTVYALSNILMEQP